MFKALHSSLWEAIAQGMTDVKMGTSDAYVFKAKQVVGNVRFQAKNQKIAPKMRTKEKTELCKPLISSLMCNHRWSIFNCHSKGSWLFYALLEFCGCV